MKKNLMTSFAILLALSVPAFAAEEGVATSEPVVEEAVQGPVDVGNKICPISGEKVGQMGEVVKVEHKGKNYNLCCAMCVKDFKKDPEKYSAIAEDEVKANAAAEVIEEEKTGY